MSAGEAIERLARHGTAALTITAEDGCVRFDCVAGGVDDAVVCSVAADTRQVADWTGEQVDRWVNHVVCSVLDRANAKSS
jgi:hypothetical protein